MKYYSASVDGGDYNPSCPSQIIKGGVYRITNIVNGKVYIGSSVDTTVRFREHKRKLNLGNHYNTYLQRSWNKYGAGVFEFEVIERVRKGRLIERESHHINEHTKTCELYNSMEASGDRVCHSKETKKKLSEATKAAWGGEYRDRMLAIQRDRAKLHEYKGELKTSREWAEEFNVNYTSFRQKLERGMSVEEAKNIKPLKNDGVMFNGEKRSLKDIAADLGMDYKILWFKVKRGFTINEIMLGKTEKKNILYNGRYYGVKGLARKVGMAHGTLNSRLGRGMTLLDAIKQPVQYKK